MQRKYLDFPTLFQSNIFPQATTFFRPTVWYKSNLALGIFAALGLSNSAQADTFFGLYAKADYWSATLDGDFGNGDSNGFFNSIEGDTGGREEHGILSAQFEHGIPLIPNLWVRNNNVDYQATRRLTDDVSVGNADFSAGSDVNYQFDFSHTDIALYYELLDNWITIDVGLAAKNIQFDFRIQQGAQAFAFTDSGAVPMLYGKAAFELPFSGWHVSAQGMALSFEDSRIEDVNVELGYSFNDWMHASVGYRQMVIDVEIPSLTETEMTLDGSYLSVLLHI